MDLNHMSLDMTMIESLIATYGTTLTPDGHHIVNIPAEHHAQLANIDQTTRTATDVTGILSCDDGMNCLFVVESLDELTFDYVYS